MLLTREQRVALKRVFDRRTLHLENGSRIGKNGLPPTVTYRGFRRTVRQGYDCIMVPWCGMWLGIESDGYTHS